MSFILSGTKPKKASETKETVGPTSQSNPSPTPSPVATSPFPRTPVRVVKVIDGDTINIESDGQKETIRMIGLDAPESVDPRKPVQCFGVEASNKLKDLIDGKSVFLEDDPSQGERDKYNRLLRYVFLEDGTNIDKLMISEGYAHEYTYNLPYKYQEEFKQAGREAREAKRGLWADDSCKVLPAATSAPENESLASTGTGNFTCSGKTKCGEMASCEEARFYLKNCDLSRLDADKDGIPCESLCR